LIRDDDTAVYGDKGYASGAKKRAAQAAGVLWAVKEDGLPPEKWSSLMYGLWPDGGLKNGKEATHCGRDRHEAAAG
jgi:hypothetical protein